MDMGAAFLKSAALRARPAGGDCIDPFDAVTLVTDAWTWCAG